jgi:hypothetical protein
MTCQKTIPGATDQSISTVPSLAMVTYQQSMKSPHLVILSPFDFNSIDTAQTSENSFTKLKYKIMQLSGNQMQILYETCFCGRRPQNPESIPAS